MVKKIISFSKFERLFDRFAPKKGAIFEFSGVIRNTKIPKKELAKVTLALDFTTDSVKQAAKQKSDCLIVFHAPDSLTDSLIWHTKIKKIATKARLALYKAHLRLNFCKNGVNEMLCKMCGFDARPLTFLYEDKFQITGGAYKVVGIHTLSQVVKKLQAIYPPEVRVYHPKTKEYKKIIVSSGSGFKKEFFEAFKPDMIISGEAKHGIICLAKEYGTTLVEATHWATEDRPLQKIVPLLQKQLGIPVIYISQNPQLKIYR